MMQNINDQHEAQDLALQHEVAQSILRSEESGNLVGAEAPVFRCHTFVPNKAGDTYARILTRQLNHLARGLGVLGFQVLYKEDAFEEGANKPDSGFFEVRVFAEAPSVQGAETSCPEPEAVEPTT